MLVTHPPLATDSFTPYIKAAALMGKVKTFNNRYRMRYTDSKSAPGAESTGPAKEDDNEDPRENVEFQMLDRLIRTFISRIPTEYKDPFGGEDGVVDPLLYSAHLLPSVSVFFFTEHTHFPV